MEYDVVIVGAGPAGLAAAIRLKQLAAEQGGEVSVCVLEKGSEVGAHILSGACLEPRALNELIPDWREQGAPLDTPVTADEFLYLTETMSFRLPTPPQMHNEGNYIVSLGNVVRWLGQQAEALGVEIYPGFAAAELLQDEAGRVRGVATGNMGVTKEGEEGPNFQPGMELHARLTLLAEGCRGSLTKTAMERFKLREGVQPQTYGLGVKELWEIDPAPAHQGPGDPHHRLADRQPHLWRLLALHVRGEPGLGRLRGRARLREPLPVTVRGDAALQDPSPHPALPGGRPADRLRGARAVRGRVPVDPQAHLPGRGPDRRHGGLPQRAQDQGHPHRHEVRHGRGRGRLRGAAGRGGAARARRLSGAAASKAGSGTSSTRSATSGPPSAGACGRPWPTARSTPTCCAAGHPGPCASGPTTRRSSRPS